MAGEGADIVHTLWAGRHAVLAGLEVTGLMAGGGLALGLGIAAPLAVAGVFGPRLLRLAVGLYVFVLRGTPLLVTLLFLFFGLGAVWQALPAMLAAALAMGLYAGAHLTEIFRGAIQSIPAAQIDAAKAVGLPFCARLTAVVAPLSLPRALPSVTNVAADMVKASTLVSALGVGDLLMTGQDMAMRTLLIPQVYITLWAAYLAINLGLGAVGRWLEGRFRHVVY